MPDVTPSGMMSSPVANLRTLLSTCTTFQTWVSAASAALALPKIYEIEMPASSTARPFAVVSDGDILEGERINASGAFAANGSLFVLFEADVATANKASERNAHYQFMNDLGGIIEELMEDSGGGAVIHLTGFSKKSLARADEQERRDGEDYMQAIFEFTYD